MKTIVKVVTVLASFAAYPSVANAEEAYIHIGDRCYVSIGMVGGYPILLQIVCPNNLSENP